MKASRGLAVVCIAVVVGVVFAEAIFGGGRFVLRDADAYYASWFRYVRDQWGRGEPPLWNPLDGLGAPLAADPSASVFYPGKLLFALPIGFETAYAIYLIGHVVLAAAATYRVARRFHAGPEAATAAALAYAFSGSVLFLYTNAVYLVGAAWLPLAWEMLDRTLVDRSLRAAFGLGVVAALMILGGDPQTVYHIGLLALLDAFLLRREELAMKVREATNAVACRATSDAAQPQSPASPDRISRLAAFGSQRLALLAAAGTAALLLSAVQVLPSAASAQRSERASTPAARSLYELPAALQRGVSWSDNVDSLLGRRMEPCSHHEHAFHFSVGPWRWAEWIWPNVGGQAFPEYRRWFDAIPAEGLVWTPSLYMGLPAIVLACAAVFRRRPDPRTRRLLRLVGVAVVASLGEYGPGRILNELRIADGGDPHNVGPIGDACGGLYWLFTVGLPGYIEFRYPAKWLTVAALGLSLLAARGWDLALGQPSPRLLRNLLALAGLSGAAAAAVAIFQPFSATCFRRLAPDVIYGPFHAAGAAADCRAALLATMLAALAVAGLLQLSRARPLLAARLLLLVAAIDLVVANGRLVVCESGERSCLSRERSCDSGEAFAVAHAITRDRAGSMTRAMAHVEADLPPAERTADNDGIVSDAAAGPFRVYRRPMWFPNRWSSESSQQRTEELTAWQRDTLWPRYHLNAGLPLWADPVGLVPDDVQRVLQRERGSREFLNLVGVKYLILRGDARLPGGRRLSLQAGGLPDAREPEDVSLWHNPAAMPRAWIARVPAEPRNAAASDERCTVTHYGPNTVALHAVLKRPGVVVLADAFDPDWQLELASDGGPARPATILRTCEVLRGASLPAGEHRLTFRYRPMRLYVGAVVSGAAWLVAGTAAFAGLVRSRRRRRIASRDG